MALVELYQSLPPLARAALGLVVTLQAAALAAWAVWLVKELRGTDTSFVASAAARDKKNK